MEAFTTLQSTVILLPRDDIDTDQIIPARYLKVTDKAGLADGLFYGWRYHKDDRIDPDFPLNRPELRQAHILLTGDNFGCGSSREHAPWALVSWGFRVVISTSFADIFNSNALKNGLLPVIIDPGMHSHLLELLETDHLAILTVNLQAQTLLLPDGIIASFPIDPFSKACLLQGVDSLGYILKHERAISDYELNNPYRT